MDATIIIEGKPFHYNAENLTVDGAPDITFEDAKSILFKAKELLEGEDIEFGLHHGTLLGAVREHSFIPFDYDVDLYVKDLPHLLRVIPKFNGKGFKLCRVTPGRLYSFRYGKAYIDFYILRKAPFPFNFWCYWVGSDIQPKKYYDKTQKIDFLGGKFTIPQDAEGKLVLSYGKTWRTPIKGGHGRYNVYPVYLYRKIKRWLTNKKKKQEK